jgi:hypothetical protein
MRVRAAAGAASFRRRPRLEQFVDEARTQVEELKKAVHDPNHLTRREAALLRAAAEREARVKRALEAMPAAEETKARQTKKKARDKAPRVSTTDPDARVMKMGDGGFRPAYNVQLSTDVDSRFIVGVAVSSTGSDAGLLGPALANIERRLGELPGEMLVDGGFVNTAAFDDAAARGVVVYAPVPKPRDETLDPHARKPDDSDATAEWRERMRTDDAKEIYKERAATAETTNADLRCKRGLQQFVVRGSAKVLSVTLWAALAYNLLRVPLAALIG